MKQIIPTTRADLARMIEPGNIVIELGVAAGVFATEMLTQNSAISYVGIDRWSDHHDGAEYGHAKTVIEILGGRVIRSVFSDALPLIDDAAAAMIYIDGYAHTGQEGGQTLRDWWPKLRTGGIFSGHDYSGHYPQTKAAVDAFVLEHGLDLKIIEEKPHPSWWVIKPNTPKP